LLQVLFLPAKCLEIRILVLVRAGLTRKKCSKINASASRIAPRFIRAKKFVATGYYICSMLMTVVTPTTVHPSL
jgi:hypothetical protein